jgi:hypothetical protein
MSLSLHQPLPLSLCHCQPAQLVVVTTTYTMHKSCINLYLNLYHQSMHQPCTKLVLTICINKSASQHNLSQQHVSSISSTKSDLFTKINHQENSQPYVQYHQDVHESRLFTNINKMYHNQDVLIKVYTYIYATSSINHVPTILLASASNNVPSMYQSCINYRSSYDSSRCTNITIPYTSYIYQLINYVSQYVTQPYAKYIHQDIQQIGL